MTPQQIESLYRIRMSLPPAERAAVEAAHAELVRQDDASFGLPQARQAPQAPNVEDNLDAAATPIAVEPVAGERRYAPQAKSLDEWKDQRLLYLGGIGLEPDPETRETPDEVRARQDAKWGTGSYDREMARRAAVAAREGRRGESAASMEARGRMPEDGSGAGGGLLPGETLEEYGENYGAALRRNRPPVRAGGMPDPEQEAYNASTGVRPAQQYGSPDSGYATDGRPTVMVDGVAVPVVLRNGEPMLDAKGNYMTTLGDERRAKEQSVMDGRRAQWSKEAQEEMARLEARGGRLWDGLGGIDESTLTPEEKKTVEARRSATGDRRLFLMAERMAKAAGIPVAEALANLTNTNKEGTALPGVNEAGRRELAAMAADGRNAQAASADAARVRRAQASQNPMEYLGRDDINDWQRMVMAERFLRTGQTLTPLGVDARQLDRAAQWAGQAVTGAIAGGATNGAAGQAFGQKQRDAAKNDFDKWWATTLGSAPGAARYYTQDQYNQAVSYLMNQYGLKQSEAEAIAQSRGRPRVSGGRGAGGMPPADAPSVGFPDENEPGGMGTPM